MKKLIDQTLTNDSELDVENLDGMIEDPTILGELHLNYDVAQTLRDYSNHDIE